MSGAQTMARDDRKSVTTYSFAEADKLTADMGDAPAQAPSRSDRKSDVTFSYDHAVELTGHGCYNYLLLATCSLITNAVAMDMFGMSVVTAAARCDLQLSIITTGLLNSTPLAGVVIFAFPWGYYADRCGRRRALLLSTIGGFLFGVLATFSPNWQTMFVLKLAGCSFSSASYTLTMTYLGEGIGSSRRSRYLFIMNSANLAAELVFYSLAYFILPLNISVPVPWLGLTLRSWRVYNFVLVTPLGIGALLLLSLYESPKLLVCTGKVQQAVEVLTKIYERNGGKKEYSVKALSVEPEDVSSGGPIWSTLVKQTVPLFKPPLLWRTIQLYYLLGICSSTNNVFLIWYPMMVNSFFNSFAGGGVVDQSFCERVVSNITVDAQINVVHLICDDSISPNTIYSGMLLGLTFTIINLSASAVASYRRLVLIACFVASGLCLVLVEHIKEPVTNMVAFTLVQITAVGIGSVATYFVDLYPTTYRGLVTSLSMMYMRLISLAGINIVGPRIIKHCSITFYCWAVYVASGVIVALFLPSDKKRYK